MNKLFLVLFAGLVLFSGCVSSPTETSSTLQAVEQTTQPVAPSTAPPTTQVVVTTTLAPTTTMQNNIETECSVDSDCITSSCCHPTSCVKSYERVCNMLCTQNCEGPIDCGRGSCGCINGKCEVIPASTTTLAAAQTSTVDIQNFAFNPSTINVNVGATVTWANQDSAPHTVASESGGELASETLSKGQTYSHKFSTPGTYTYRCGIHHSMKGTVVVQ